LSKELIGAALQELIYQLDHAIADPPYQPIGSADLCGQAAWEALTILGFDPANERDLLKATHEKLFMMATELGYAALIQAKEAQINERYVNLPLIPRTH
jgi:hypothetical protein